MCAPISYQTHVREFLIFIFVLKDKFYVTYFPVQSLSRSIFCFFIYFSGFPYVKKFYLIYDVFYARQINVYVRINDEVDEFCVRERTPIGFRLKRYKIQPNGLIGPVKSIINKEWHVHWIKNSMFRNPMDTLPSVPTSSKSTNKYRHTIAQHQGPLIHGAVMHSSETTEH